MGGHALVTGGAGFIGSSLVRRLLARSCRVRVLDDFSTGHRENLADLLGRVELVEGTICDADTCRRAVRGCDVVFHLAADVSVPRSMADPAHTHRTNVDGLFNCLSAARDAGVRRLVFSSSSAVYGEREELPKIETHLPAPVSPYGASKAIGETYCSIFTRCFNLETVSLRYFNIFGPRQDPQSQYAAAIPAFVSRMLRGEPPVVFGDGEQTRDFTFVDNAVQANLLAAEATLNGPAVVNIGCGEPVSVNRIIAVLNRLLGTHLEPRYDPLRPGDIVHSWADITAAGRILGYSPAVALEEGLRRAIDWYKEGP